MKPEVIELLARIDEKQAQHGLNDRQVSIAVTGKADLMRDMRRKGTTPSADKLDMLAAYLGTTSRWLLRGEDEQEAEERAAAARNLVRSEVRGAGQVGISDVRTAFYGETPGALPLIGTAMGGELTSFDDLDDQVETTELHLGEVLEYLARPLSLANDGDAYAITIVGDSMFPRFKPGERATVSPKSPVHIGDDVIVQLRGADGDDERIKLVLVKELVRRSAGFVELRQYNPLVTFRIEAKRVASLHKVRSLHF